MKFDSWVCVNLDKNIINFAPIEPHIIRSDPLKCCELFFEKSGWFWGSRILVVGQMLDMFNRFELYVDKMYQELC